MNFVNKPLPRHALDILYFPALKACLLFIFGKFGVKLMAKYDKCKRMISIRNDRGHISIEAVKGCSIIWLLRTVGT